MVKAARNIGVVLPAREVFGLRKSGALALCARDFANFSQFRDDIVVMGAAVCEYEDVRYRRLENWRRWWMRGREAYARAVVDAASAEGVAILEVFNRPHTVRVVQKRLPKMKLVLHLENDAQTMAGCGAARERQDILGRLGRRLLL